MEDRKERILVVSGEPSLNETLVRLLSLEGCDALGAGTLEEAMSRLEAERISGILLDLPGIDVAVDAFIHQVRFRCQTVGIVLVTDAPGAERQLELDKLGADDSFVRRHCRTELPIVLERTLRTVQLRRQNLELSKALELEKDKRIRESNHRLRVLRRARRLSLKTLVNALGAREEETRRHCQRVAHYSMQIAERIGMGERERGEIFRGALLHDIGKIGIPDHILLKPGPLDDGEWAVMHSHPRVGHTILHGLTFLKRAAECSLCHHERWDGEGYPLGLSEGDIPETARIVSVADALDAMSVERPYRGPLSFDDILDELTENRGTQFDPRVIDAALSLYRGWNDLHPEAIRRRRQSRARREPQRSVRAALERDASRAA